MLGQTNNNLALLKCAFVFKVVVTSGCAVHPSAAPIASFETQGTVESKPFNDKKIDYLVSALVNASDLEFLAGERTIEINDECFLNVIDVGMRPEGLYIRSNLMEGETLLSFIEYTYEIRQSTGLITLTPSQINTFKKAVDTRESVPLPLFDQNHARYIASSGQVNPYSNTGLPFWRFEFDSAPIKSTIRGG